MKRAESLPAGAEPFAYAASLRQMFAEGPDKFRETSKMRQPGAVTGIDSGLPWQAAREEIRLGAHVGAFCLLE
jgi:hypothetical protein